MSDTLITLKNGDASLEVSINGANILSWTIKDRNCLWLSEAAVTDGSRATRGGVPVVFPSFGKSTVPPTSSLPQHGFARTSKWRLIEKETAKAILELSSADLAADVARLWPYEFRLTLAIELHATSLEISAEVLNNDAKEFDFQFLLHTYFFVDDVSSVTINGLRGYTYWDKNTGKTASESRQMISIEGPTDRVYRNVDSDVSIDVSGRPAFRITREGLPDVVIWNPWLHASETMADFRPEQGYKNMICVEPGYVHEFKALDAGTWQKQKLRIESFVE